MKFSELRSNQVGTYAEYYVKMELTRNGVYVFSSEVDDQGIDFVARLEKDGLVKHFDVQVKSLRTSSSYVFITEKKFIKSPTFMVALVLFDQEGITPEFFLIPASAWDTNNSSDVFKFYPREIGTSHKTGSEYGINISKKNWAELEEYRFTNTLGKLL